MPKICNKCQEPKELHMFFNDKNNKTDGKYSLCKVCKQTGTYRWREGNRDKYNRTQRDFQKRLSPERRYGTEIKRRYGCTLEQYNAMLIAQGAACAICKGPHNPAVKRGRLYVDHDHGTGVVRALLCHRCNVVLGYAKDDSRILLEAITYLARHKNKI